jgi:2'-5' RNA ligase
MRKLPYNIVIYPPAKIREKAITISKRLKKEGGLFSLGEKTFIPHLTIYILDLPAKNEKKVGLALKELASTLKPMKLTFLRYRNSNGGYTGAVYKRTKAITDLQMKILNAINPFREGIVRDKYKPILKTLPKHMRSNVERFGFSDVGKEYHPHLTFTRFPNDREIKLKTIQKLNFSFTANEIGFCRRGEHGTCKKLITKFRINS